MCDNCENRASFFKDPKSLAENFNRISSQSAPIREVQETAFKTMLETMITDEIGQFGLVMNVVNELFGINAGTPMPGYAEAARKAEQDYDFSRLSQLLSMRASLAAVKFYEGSAFDRLPSAGM